jgi:hypothetical protein
MSFAMVWDVAGHISQYTDQSYRENKTDSVMTVRSKPGYADGFSICWGKCSQFEHPSLARSNTTFEFIQQITFPQRALLARFTNLT